MHAHKLQITIPENHEGEISFQLPADFPSGSAEVIVLSNSQSQDAIPSSQAMAAALKDLLSFQPTPQEDKILDDFERFRREHPFSLNSLAEKL
jgi:hypothetical protein